MYFQTKKYQFLYILDDLAMEDVGIFCGNSPFFPPLGMFYVCPFGIFCGHLV
jgi:hypothetical protein